MLKEQLRVDREAMWALALAAVGVVGVSLGFIGFMVKFGLGEHPMYGLIDNIWRSFALLLMQIPPAAQGDARPDNWWLLVARVIAPAATVGFAYRFVLALVRGGERAYRLRDLERHVILVGSNDCAVAWLQSLAEEVGDTRPTAVVLIAANADDVLAPVGIPLHRLSAEATDARVLARAQLDSASNVLLMEDSDDLNLQILRIVVESKRTSRPANVVVRLENQMLARQLEREDAMVRRAIQADGSPAISVLLFDRRHVAARVLFECYPLVDVADLTGQPRVQVAVVGWSGLTLPVLEQLARVGPYGENLPRVDLFVNDRSSVLADIAAAQPSLLPSPGVPAVLDLHVHSLDSRLGLPTAEQMRDLEPGPAPSLTAVIVTFGEDDSSAGIALALRERSRTSGVWRVPIFVEMRSESAMSALIEPLRHHPEWADRVVPVGLMPELCRLGPLLEREEAACRVHEAYRALRERNDTHVGSEERDQPWPRLRQTFRAASRRAIDHLPIKLARAGYHVTGRPLRTPPGVPLDADPATVTTLAALEHRSWEIDRLLDGWRQGDRDDRHRRHPAIGVPFAELDQRLGYPLRHFDIEQVHAAANMLSRDGNVTARKERLVGVIGHNAVSLQDRERLVAALEATVATFLTSHAEDYVSLVTPLAPGADLMLTEQLCVRLQERKGQHRIVVIRTLPFAKVCARFLDGYFDNQETRAWSTRPSRPFPDRGKAQTAITTRIEELLRENPDNLILDMTPLATFADHWSPEHQHHAFRAANAYIAQRCHTVFAFHDASRHDGGAGGTAEALFWCRNPMSIPERWRLDPVPAPPELIVLP